MKQEVHRSDAGKSSDITIKNIDDLGDGRFLRAGRDLGVTAFGMNVLRYLEPWDGYPYHDHTDDGQGEVYVVLDGTATLEAEGERWELATDALVRVGPSAKRKVTAGQNGATILVLGGVPKDA